MRLDGNQYAKVKTETPLPYQLFETSCPLYNRETGFDMVYQENKVFNLKLAAATLDRVVIRPHKTFSLWKLVRYADRDNAKFYEVLNGEPLYCRRNNKVFEEVDVKQKTILTATGACASEKLLYRNKCEIGYPLPYGTDVIEKGSEEK